MNEMNYSVFCIDFRNFKTEVELDELFKEVGLDMKGQEWFKMHKGQWIPNVIVNRIWIDSVTLSLVAYETNTQQMIYPSFAEFLNNSKGIDKTFRYASLKFTHRTDLTLDSILDKILEQGSDSLTDFEKNFLKQQSEAE